MNTIAAVVVTYNRLEMLKKCIESILNQSAGCDLIIVNNASTDGTEIYLDSIGKDNGRITVINSKTNAGGAGGFNIGMREAVRQGYKYIWCMDDDTMPKPDALKQMIIAHRRLRGNYGFLAGLILWKDGSRHRMNVPKSGKIDPSAEKFGLRSIKQASFVSFWIKADTVKRAGLPIKDFFIWGDDVEYSRRLAVRMKLPCYLVSKSVALHMTETNNGSSIATDTEDRIDRYRYAFRNENFLYRCEGIKGIIYYLLKCAYNVIKIIIKAPDNKLKRIKVVLSQMIAGFRFNPEIEKIGDMKRNEQ